MRGNLVIRAAAALLALIRKVVDATILLLFLYMIVAVVAQVLGRYLLNFSIAWATETATFAQIAMVLLGAGYAMRHDMHVGIDVVTSHLPDLLRRALALAVMALALWFLWVVYDGSFRLLKIGAFQRSPALRIPMYWPYLLLPLGSAYFALELTLAQLPKIFGPRARPAAEEPTIGEGV